MIDELGQAEAFCAQLSREPDFDAPELQAYDAADLLLLQAAARLIERDLEIVRVGKSGSGPELVEGRELSAPGTSTGSVTGAPPDDRADTDHLPQAAGSLAVIGDRHGALTLGTAALLGASGIRVHQDPLLSERALDANAKRLGLEGRYEHHPLGESLFAGVELVLMQLPRSLAELDEIAWQIARGASPTVTVLAGGRDKHMTRGMNEVLARYFGEVTAGRGWRKARVLTARGPHPAALRQAQHEPSSDLSESEARLGAARFPVRGRDPELSFALAAFGATFGGAALDHGSRLLLRTLRETPPATPGGVLDIGCGNGVLAVSAALAWPEASVIASDQSAAAVAATRLTAQWAGVGDRVEVQRADASGSVPEGWADLVLLNPPFHAGSTVHAGVAHRLIRSSVRVLAPGGELRLVFNSHLRYRSLVEQVIGPSRQLARDRTFTVLAATRR